VNATATTPAALAALYLLGWEDGAPRHITPETLEVDRRVCRALRCPHCRRRGLGFHPLRSGRRYRVLAACAGCRHHEEV
jgi:hypothetical protein